MHLSCTAEVFFQRMSILATSSQKSCPGVNATMRAVRIHQFGGAENLTVDCNLPVPTLTETNSGGAITPLNPTGKQLLIKVFCAGVNPIDTYLRESVNPIGRPDLPWTPGIDCAGTVVHNCGEFKAGQRVFTMGALGSYAEFCLADPKATFHLADRLSFAQGAAMGIPYFTAYRALFQRVPVKSGETVLIHGASGAVGQACLQLASGRGFKLLATAGSPEGLAAASRAGADMVFDHSRPDYVDTIRAATSTADIPNGGCHVIIEMLANKNLTIDIEDLLVINGGRVVIVGCRDYVTLDPRAIMRKEATISGVAVRRAPPTDTFEMKSGVLSAIESGLVNPVIAKEYTMENAADAHRDIISKPALGKLIIRIRPDKE